MIIVNPDNILESWSDKVVSMTDWNAYTDFSAIFPEKVLNQGKIIKI